MDRLITLSKRLDDIIEFKGCVLSNGRAHNPLYDPEAVPAVHHIGEGSLQSVPLNQIVSTQATINRRKVRSMKERLQRGTAKPGSPPVLSKQGKRLIVLDGNHRLAAALRAGKRSVKAIVQ